MTLKDERELATTRDMLREIEQRYQSRLHETPSNPRVHELTLKSLRRLIVQLKEEIARFETRQPV